MKALILKAPGKPDTLEIAGHAGRGYSLEGVPQALTRLSQRHVKGKIAAVLNE